MDYNLKCAKNRDEHCIYTQMLNCSATIALKYQRMKRDSWIKGENKEVLMAFTFQWSKHQLIWKAYLNQEL